MIKIHRPAWKTKEGKVLVAPRSGMRHKEMPEGEGERGFVDTQGRFLGREEAAEVAVAAGQVPKTVKRLHSVDLPEYKQRRKK